MIAETKCEKDTKIWKKFLSKHWEICITGIVVAVLAVIGAIYVYLWFVADAQAMGLVPTILGQWAMGHIITFLVHLIFWEVIFIGIPLLIVFAVTFFAWWKKLPATERKEYRDGHLFGKRSKKTDASGGFSFLVFIVFCIKVYFDGAWGVAIATWSFDYLVYSCLWSFIWVALIFGIPILIGGTWWLQHEMKKKP